MKSQLKESLRKQTPISKNAITKVTNKKYSLHL